MGTNYGYTNQSSKLSRRPFKFITFAYIINLTLMNRIDRLFGILVLLQTKKYITAEKISDHYQISIRTVYRDIKALIEQGIPISFEQPKGYFIVQGYFLPPVSFNTEEANALLIMERLVAGFTDQSIQTHYSSALNKVKAVLRSQQKEKLEFLNENIKLQLPDYIKNEFQHLSVLQHVISSKILIELDYINNNNESSLRTVESIGLIFYAFNWHLIAWCHLRAEYRDFRVSRIGRIRCLELPFRKQDHMSVADYMKKLPVNY
ncbi:YafY family protein [Pedobacter nutrimenti]|uniref:helix-turn-helix transcriptional regulator n=1 Tax=Pedobacter nutrimenti TaxID=1241337 RepID=UPI00292FE4A4|nr:YafY family protein [Pedobacter nutrimenti]